MPAKCCIVGCSKRAERDNIKFYKVPQIQGNKLADLSKRRQEAWLKAINRADLKNNNLLYTHVCANHFISGRSAKIQDEQNPDWVPNLNLECKTPLKRKPLAKSKRSIKKRKIVKHDLHDMVVQNRSCTPIVAYVAQEIVPDDISELSMDDLDEIKQEIEIDVSEFEKSCREGAAAEQVEPTSDSTENANETMFVQDWEALQKSKSAQDAIKVQQNRQTKNAHDVWSAVAELKKQKIHQEMEQATERHKLQLQQQQQRHELEILKLQNEIAFHKELHELTMQKLKESKAQQQEQKPYKIK